MNQWQNGQTNGMFQQTTQGHLNPAQMYNNIGNGAQFDISQFTQGLQNGNSNTSTPTSFPGPAFQPGSVIPAKRSHDGMSGSPVQAQTSRSQTPNFSGAFPNPQGGQQFANAPNPYAHLQQSGSANATPSPTMQNQQFRPPTQQPQRMQNASPSPFPQQQQASFGNQMSPVTQPNSSQPTSMPQQSQMAGFNQQYGMNNNMGISNMSNSMQGQASNMNQLRTAQQIYQQRLMQQQAQLRNSGMMGQRAIPGQQAQLLNNTAQQRSTGQMPNGQAGAQPNLSALQVQQVQAQQQKRVQFLNALKNHVTNQGKQFDEHPNIGGRPVDYLALWTLTTQMGGSQNVDRNSAWQIVATKMGFPENQYPTAAQELKQLHNHAIAQYERMWFAAKQAANKQEQARMHAHQMAGLDGPTQASPTKMMQGGNQPNQFGQYQQNQQPPPQATPVQANAQLPQNGMSTPQQQMLQHRRNSSLRKPEQMTPQQAGGQGVAVASPHSTAKAAQRSPSVKQETSSLALKNEQPQSTHYVPAATSVECDGGLEVMPLLELGNTILRYRPDMPMLPEMGLIDTKAIMLSLASGIHAEVRYALDTLVALTHEQAVSFDLSKCEDLMDVIMDCAEEQIELLSEEAAEVSDALDLAPYEDVLRASRSETESLQEVHPLGTPAYDLDRTAEKVIALTSIMRNLSFYEHNHVLLTQSSLLKWLSNTIRLLGTRNLLLRTYWNTQDFYKDMIIFLSNITQSLELPSRDDALHILHFLLAFAPQPAPSYASSGHKVNFSSFSPIAHRYLPPAVDCLAKLLARQDPNRMLYKSIFTASSSSLAVSESPLDLLTRAFALSISVLPNRAARTYGNNMLLRTVEARKAYLTQGMLAADILTSLMPSSETELARAWIESEDGWAVGLLSLAALLSVDKQQQPPPPNKNRELGLDTDTFKLIAHRALTMMKRLAEKAGKIESRRRSGQSNGIVNGESTVDEDAEDPAPKWEGIPHGHAILGACLLANTDKTSLRLLCGLFEMSMQQPQ
jgi:SWI/SNF chromatin-remodeling complex subunit SWI1